MSTAPTGQDEDSGKPPDRIVVGLLADPEGAPVEVSTRLREDLAEALGEHLNTGTSWDVQVSYERLPPGSSGQITILDVGGEWLSEYGWDLAICITDLPLRRGKRPLVADVSRARRTAVLSLPAFGGMRLTRRVRNVVIQLVAELIGRGADSEQGDGPQRRGRKPLINRLSGHFDRVTPDDADVDVRIVASRGRLRLLVGMVRANRPWLVIQGLTGAAAGALAFSAFYLISSGLWELSDALGPVRLSLATVGSLAVLVSWLIIRHQLWESPRRADLPHERQEVVLFNASTVLTLAIGMAFMYLGLFVLILGAAGLLLSPSVLANYVQGSPDLGSYAKLAWLATCTAGIAGALGSSFDSEKSVREAAYSYRERERRVQREREQQTEDAAAAETGSTDEAEVETGQEGQNEQR